jgi:hypothetical protein
LDLGELIDQMEKKAMQAISASGAKIRRDYREASLMDLVENTVDLAMAVLKTYGVTDFTEDIWYYYIGFFNCCRKEQFAYLVGQDAKHVLLRMHSKSMICEKLRSYTNEQYEACALEAAERKKDEILKFWDEYIETRKMPFR